MSAKYWYKRIALCCLLGAACLSAPALAQNSGSPGNGAKTSNRQSGEFVEPPYDASKYQRYFPEALFMVGADKSESEAYGYMRAAAEKGYAKAQFWMGEYYYKHDVQSKAVYWYKKAAEQNYTQAKKALASMSGQETAEPAADKNAAISGSEILIVSKAVYLNTAQYDDLKPYDAYTQGAAAVSKGDPKGYALLESSARRGCSRAKLALANLFLPYDHPLKWEETYVLDLEDKPLDNKERMQRYLQWMNSAAENGSSTAAKELAELYREGKHVGKDANQIFKYTKLAALAKEPEYMYRLGTYYAQGLGCQKDRNAAVKWIKQAAHLGSGEASQWLEERRGHYEVKEFGHNAGSYEIMNSYGYSYTAAHFRSGSNSYFESDYINTVNRLNGLLHGSSAGGLKSFEVVGILRAGNSDFFSITDKNGERLPLRETSSCPSSGRYDGQVVRCVVYPYPSEYAICSDIYPCSSYIKDGTKKQYIPPKVKGWEDLLNDK